MLCVSQQVLRKLGVASPDQPLPLDGSLTHDKFPTTSDEVNNPHIIIDNSNCNNRESRVTSSGSGDKGNHIGNGHVGGNNPSLTVVPTGKMRKRRVSSSSVDPAVVANLRKNQEEMMQELAQAKLEYAEAMVQLEQKKMEARQALSRESQAVREVDAARSYITVLEQRVRIVLDDKSTCNVYDDCIHKCTTPPLSSQLSECQMEKLSCPHCSQKLEQKETDSADPNSSDVLFSHLRAVWNSQAATQGSGSPSRTPHFGPTWT